MNLGEIVVMLYKVGTKIRCGLDLFDTIVTTADKAKDLIRGDVWEDHPEKAKFVALPEDEKEKCEKPAGLGFLTCVPGVDHAAEVAEADAKAAAEAKAQAEAEAAAKAEADAKAKAEKAPKADKKAADNGDGNKG